MKNANKLSCLVFTAAAAAAGACNIDTLTGEEMELLQQMQLGQLPKSPGNMYADDPAAAELGQRFFFDGSFSGPLHEEGGLGPEGATGMVSCATCHDPSSGGADKRNLGATSLAAGWTDRNTPTVINAAFSRWQFWDGRRDSLWSQALAPIEAENEHNTTRLQVVHNIFQKYREPYERVFGAMANFDDPTRFPKEGRPGMAAFEAMSEDDRQLVNRVFANFGKALEAYERRLVDSSSAFDRFVRSADAPLSAAAVRGAKLFVGRAACNECHSGSMLADGKFHNHGVPQVGTKVPREDLGRESGIPKLMADEFNGAGRYSDAPAGDLAVHAEPLRDRGAFKTPTLRNISKTGPYMHTGAFNSLWDVVAWYNSAASGDTVAGTRRAASIVPLRLTDEEMSDLVEFLRTLDGDPLPTSLVTRPAP
jgi:cytochrome c peroxidase